MLPSRSSYPPDESHVQLSPCTATLMAPRTSIGVLQPTIPTQIPLPVMHPLNRNKKQGYWAGPKASKNGMKPGKDNISKELTDKQGLTRNVKEERRSIK